jgi:transcriptional regulator with XRE-family HTH domain
MSGETLADLDSTGARIAALRVRQGVAPATLAAALGIDEEKYLTLVETGKMRLDISEVVRCAEVLSVTTREVLGIALSPKLALAQRLSSDY